MRNFWLIVYFIISSAAGFIGGIWLSELMPYNVILFAVGLVLALVVTLIAVLLKRRALTVAPLFASACSLVILGFLVSESIPVNLIQYTALTLVVSGSYLVVALLLIPLSKSKSRMLHAMFFILLAVVSIYASIEAFGISLGVGYFTMYTEIFYFCAAIVIRIGIGNDLVEILPFAYGGPFLVVTVVILIIGSEGELLSGLGDVAAGMSDGGSSKAKPQTPPRINM